MSIGAVPGPRAAPASPLVALRLSDQLAERLAAQIEGGGLKPGDRLPTEQRLALQHGVSRTVVREAVHQLKSRRLIVSRQGSGIYVATPAAHQPLRFDHEVLDSTASVAHVLELRGALEAEVAALAARRATRRQVAAMRRALTAVTRAAAAGGDGVAEDLALHRVIAEGAGNPLFGVVFGFLEQYLRDSMRVTRANEARRPDFLAAVQAEHAGIVEAIALGDAAAARRAAGTHMRRAARRLAQGGVIEAPVPASKQKEQP